MTDLLRRRTALQATAGAALLSCLPAALAQHAGSGRAAWHAWDTFKAQFINEGGRVVSDDDGGGQTYSEGQGYALFFALVANDRPMFDKLLRWTENNLCAGDMTARLPAWLWGKRPDGTWGVIDANAASDADLWIAYALGEAGRLWNERSYRALSALLAARVLREETADIPGLGPTLLPAPKGFVQPNGRWRLNPSYMPMHLMHWLAAGDADPQWKLLVDSSLKVIRGSSPKGFTPDWTVYDAKQGFLVDTLTGQASGPAPSGFSAAMLPFLRAAGDDKALQAQRMRLEARPLRPTAYYEQVLALFGQGAFDGQYHFTAAGQLIARWKP